MKLTCNYLKKSGLEESTQKNLAHHAFRIMTDIVAGDGLGYHEEALCGNIVKNRSALKHAQESCLMLKEISVKNPQSTQIKEFIRLNEQIIKELENRIIELRSKVWW